MNRKLSLSIRRACFAACIVLLAGGAAALTQVPPFDEATVEYKDGDATLEGYFCYPKLKFGEKAHSRPAVLIAHQWKGLTEHEQVAAMKLATLGYVVLAADIYGKGIRPATPQEAGKLAGQYKSDRPLLRRRAAAALKTLKEFKDEQGVEIVDPKRVAAIGYCFGGTTVLEMARDGQDLAGVVTFHGGLDAPKTAKPGEINTKILVLHGADDPHVPPAQVQAFEDEMRDCGADWQLVAFGGAVHSFTHRDAGTDNSKGAAYNEKADRRSWKMMLDFFAETIGVN